MGAVKVRTVKLGAGGATAWWRRWVADVGAEATVEEAAGGGGEGAGGEGGGRGGGGSLSKRLH